MSDATRPGITVRQPWAQLLIAGVKRFETRPFQFRGAPGTLLIHAGKAEATQATIPEQVWLRAQLRIPARWAFGALIGAVRVTMNWPAPAAAATQKRDRDGTCDELEFGDFSPGRWAWEIERVLRFELPVAYSGRLGVFPVPLAALPVAQREQLAEWEARNA